MSLNDEKPEICGATIAVVAPAVCELPSGHEGRHKWSTVEWNFDARMPLSPKNLKLDK